MNLIYNLKNITFLSCISIFIIIFNANILAGELEASQYQIFLNIDKAEVAVSENIIIKAKELDVELENLRENIYLDRFNLVKLDGEEINPEYIEVETPFIKSSLAEQHRFLIMKKDQSESWFKIRISSDAAFAGPGEYTADMFIDGLDWEIALELKVEPFVKLYLSENNFSINIENPSASYFYISPNLFEFEVISNHSGWEVTAFLESGGLFNERGDYLSAEKVFYYIEESNKKSNNLNYVKADFDNFSEKDSISFINGENYYKDLQYIRFAVNMGENWSSQTAGLYKGIIIFTIITDN
ncbi:MAG: hypothetical protein ACOCRK_04725 [bacterium]